MVELSFLLFFPLVAGVLAWCAEKTSPRSGNWINLFALSCGLIAAIFIATQPTIISQVMWFNRFNIFFALTYDGLAALMVILTFSLAILAVLVSWHEITENRGFFHFNLMFSVSGIIGVFLAADLFLFFLFWEIMLLPMTALILVWGHENRRYAALKFFIFTQVSSLLMLIAIIALALAHQSATGSLSFNINQLQSLELAKPLEYSLMLGFFVAFAVKLPVVPFHTWLPDAHTQAPTAGSVLLAGVLLKTGAYGLLRIVMPIFTDATIAFAPIAITLGVISIVYGALMAYSQTDFKRLVAYSSISHMGFVLLAIFSWHPLALQGAIITIIAHGLSSAALFSIAGLVQHRIHSRELSQMGGMWASAPKMATFTLVFVMAGAGLPGFANFNGELFTLLGAFHLYPVHTSIAALGIIGSAVYGLHLFQKAFQGPQNVEVKDLDLRETIFTSLLVLGLLFFGLQPGYLMEITHDSMLPLLEQYQTIKEQFHVIK